MKAVGEFGNWRRAIFDHLEQFEPAYAVYFAARPVRIGFLRLGLHVSAIWAPGNRIFFNSRYFSVATSFDDPRLQSVLIHEVCHLRQGILTALSVYGELEAWQLGFRVYRQLSAEPYPANLVELMSLPLNMDRAVLRRASKLMQVYASPRYRSDLLPLYPLQKEIRYRLGQSVA